MSTELELKSMVRYINHFNCQYTRDIYLWRVKNLPEYSEVDKRLRRQRFYNPPDAPQSKSGRSFKKKVINHKPRIMKQEKQGVLI